MRTSGANVLAVAPRTCKPVRQDDSGKYGCSVVSNRPIKRPDPAIYSQIEEMALNQVPSWNSPDITTNSWAGWRLIPEITVRVHNKSTDASFAGALVNVDVAQFGLGMAQVQLGMQSLSLAPSSNRVLSFPITTALANGPQSISTYVSIQHPHDSVIINSAGSQSIHGVYTSQSGRNLTFNFPVSNNVGASRNIALSAFPNSVNANITPANRTFAAWEQITATLTCQIPNHLHGSSTDDLREEVTVVAQTQTGELIDGLTYLIRIDN